MRLRDTIRFCKPMKAVPDAEIGGNCRTIINPPIPAALELVFDNISNTPVADASSVNDWNAFFDLPVNGSPFTSVQVDGAIVKLFGGSGIYIKDKLFYPGDDLISDPEFPQYGVNPHLLKVLDRAGCVTNIGGASFLSCTELTDAYFPKAIKCFETDVFFVPHSSFPRCWKLTNIYFPILKEAGERCFDYNAIIDLSLPLLRKAGAYCFFGMQYSLKSINLPSLTEIGELGFASAGLIETIYLPLCETLGPTTGNDSVFDYIYERDNIVMTIPASLMSCNSGNPDGDITGLIANNNVTINHP